jgi:hypothetical protein
VNGLVSYLGLCLRITITPGLDTAVVVRNIVNVPGYGTILPFLGHCTQRGGSRTRRSPATDRWSAP